ncbi:bifunctional diaminohydroxyphosphoribosylaminopyrimidine deaminase/5-amino-6-(5-phosphoribosylamino)uracil reductase RibD [Pseudorhizobium endolithicum]|uniref:Riboflavin biosynthesis protein RibD n=1 Tax=Pseudorhizobium endolithicum TaxID=1191678 RepID=A0ABN7JJS4_9HYPH|nr:bifunctional diaminohydroxyphosphoribosylaminopyrimidine deaminase/5-amino-6-(5-phosphoribosylamino)uracil reductase RibD [Pseudorhizobium endolithicum]CAD7033388.1 bifunctional diaminohydroxyphosphoribosylaminopyrimidine deaminase/5-amino-6-(5-phosphoribosylamino)uracil reductase RibD [Pseudorhizobium endolithicum]
MSVTPEDRRYMAAAMRLSRWRTGLTATNPSVGAIVVRDGAIVGRAVTAPGGRPHGETQALSQAGEKARGATLYVTLEPCSHHGKTPPCADAIVAAGISRVVVSLTDPDPRVSGRGLAILRQAGIAVDEGVLEEESRRALQAYLMRQTKGRPHVTLKLAVSADGMIGRRGEEQITITGPAARAQVHVLRAEMDAILVGIGTALADDPELTCRAPGLETRSPLRVVLNRRLDLSPASKLARSARQVPVLLASIPSPREQEEGARRADGGDDASTLGRLRTELAAAGVEILETRSLATLLSTLAARGISSLLVEGGAAVAKSFLEAGLVDRILLFEGAVTVGANGIASPVTGADIPAGFRLLREAAFGPDRLTEYERSP